MKIPFIIPIVLLIGCGQSNTLGNRTLWAYGDSVTYGAYNNGSSFVNNIAYQLGYALINKAISGTTMASPNQYSQFNERLLGFRRYRVLYTRGE